ncbi:hypothetical protein K0M31_019896 [Melipona bicolor]|uniref:Uncharacterized protein n=1 Tax=Melipona bicolor TaxID=60889 RepID=A0AA40G0J7_9HYME|nr:hypothetical protein K0M31_019896 [Melipona bicolor]
MGRQSPTYTRDKLPYLTKKRKDREKRVNSLDAPVPRRKHRSEHLAFRWSPFTVERRRFFDLMREFHLESMELLSGPVSSACNPPRPKQIPAPANIDPRGSSSSPFASSATGHPSNNDLPSSTTG